MTRKPEMADRDDPSLGDAHSKRGYHTDMGGVKRQQPTPHGTEPLGTEVSLKELGLKYLKPNDISVKADKLRLRCERIAESLYHRPPSAWIQTVLNDLKREKKRRYSDEDIIEKFVISYGFSARAIDSGFVKLPKSKVLRGAAIMNYLMYKIQGSDSFEAKEKVKKLFIKAGWSYDSAIKYLPDRIGFEVHDLFGYGDGQNDKIQELMLKLRNDQILKIEEFALLMRYAYSKIEKRIS